MTVKSRRAWWILVSMLACYVILRVSLYLSPNSNFDIGPYNIHHLFTGVLILVIFGIPLVLFQARPLVDTINAAGFGAGLGMILDEWVYLIATDGSDKSYLTPVSFWGSVVVFSIVVVYILVLVFVNRKE